MKMFYQNSILILLIVFFSSCKRSFLDAKPNTSIIAPSSLADLEGLMENSNILNYTTPALPLLASDDYIFVDYSSWLSAQTSTERNSYIWAKDIYAGETNIKDWNSGYSVIFYCNNVLETLTKIDVKNGNEKQYNTIKGWALFLRSYMFYELVQAFGANYDEGTFSTDLGIPVRLKAAIDETVQRSTIKQTYGQILSDLLEAKNLLGIEIPTNTNRPSKSAAYALFSRIYLSMRKYDLAEKYADSTLAINKKIIDYNGVSKTSTTPFPYNNDETIFSITTVESYSIPLPSIANTRITVNPDLIAAYHPKDLRLSIYFQKNAATGNLYFKRRYSGKLLPFTGLATDEIYLIKAECLARRNERLSTVTFLNSLLIMRFAPSDYVPITFDQNDTQSDILQKVLIERRKELVWRTLRWSDLKRLNKEGADITLTRVLNGITYTLPPNDPRYIFPIPDDEIQGSGIQQNKR